MADGASTPGRRRARETAPTTLDPIEMAMEAEARGVRPAGVVSEAARATWRAAAGMELKPDERLVLQRALPHG